ncbi:hypothetical protein [Romboutsia sp. 13368]|uniref:hypothetical protein n=1 Tax=Romboutsia sp. 13368 TaxID=2708053 RepID=UPI0025E7E124|nr:hypothetical protein [Romboutsia sp. 13368]
MEIFLAIIFFIFILSFLTKALKRFIIFALFITLTSTLYIHINLPVLVSLILSFIILIGCKDTLFNLRVTISYIFKSRNKFKEKSLGKLVTILFELNFTLFISMCYLALANHIPHLFNVNNEFIIIAFISIYIVQYIKRFSFKKGYSFNIL